MTAEYDDMSVDAAQHVIIDSAAVAAANGHFKFSSVFLDGTLEIDASGLESGDTLIIEADHIIINTGAGNAGGLGSQDDDNRRRRRDTQAVMNGALIIGTADNPIPCDAKVIIKINENEHSQSFGAFPDSIPIGVETNFPLVN